MEHPFSVEEFSPRQGPSSGDAGQAELSRPTPVALPPLPNLPASDAVLLRPSDPHYADYLPAANKRSQLSPALRAVCKSEHAVAEMVDWVRTHNLSFAVRCGGHSYEGFSQSGLGKYPASKLPAAIGRRAFASPFHSAGAASGISGCETELPLVPNLPTAKKPAATTA